MKRDRAEIEGLLGTFITRVQHDEELIHLLADKVEALQRQNDFLRKQSANLMVYKRMVDALDAIRLEQLEKDLNDVAVTNS